MVHVTAPAGVGKGAAVPGWQRGEKRRGKGGGERERMKGSYWAVCLRRPTRYVVALILRVPGTDTERENGACLCFRSFGSFQPARACFDIAAVIASGGFAVSLATYVDVLYSTLPPPYAPSPFAKLNPLSVPPWRFLVPFPSESRPN